MQFLVRCGVCVATLCFWIKLKYMYPKEGFLLTLLGNLFSLPDIVLTDIAYSIRPKILFISVCAGGRVCFSFVCVFAYMYAASSTIIQYLCLYMRTILHLQAKALDHTFETATHAYEATPGKNMVEIVRTLNPSLCNSTSVLNSE